MLFLDTYESLWENRRVEHLRFTVDRWVRAWVQELPEVLWVITGREKLYWHKLDPEWDAVIDQHLIGGLADEDARRFLHTAGLMDTSVQNAIIRGAAGLPFRLDLAVDTYLMNENRQNSRSAVGG